MSTVRAVVARALRETAKYNPDANTPPEAVFWPDPDRAWERVIHLLQEAVPILVLGDYDPAKAQGPAIWIRAVLSAPSSVKLPSQLAERNERNPWVIYLPGHRRNSLSDMTSLDSAVSPLVEVALRSNWWHSAHGQTAWTPHSFLASKSGAGLDVASDARTKSALTSVLDHLLAEDIDELRRMGRLDAPRLHSLVMTDSVRFLLEWLDDPEGAKQDLQGVRWDAFVEVCRSTYAFDPAKDGQLVAAARLGAREGAWGGVWARFADNPRRYPNILSALDKARPAGDLFGDTDPYPDSWPSWNQEQEDVLQGALSNLHGQVDLAQTRLTVKELAALHLRREQTVWGELGRTPLARATGYLAELAELSMEPAPSGELTFQAAWYANQGYKVDDLALRAIASATTAAGRDAVCKVLEGIYDPWVDQAALTFQNAAVSEYKGETGLGVPAGTCVVFVDALRFDIGQRLVKKLAPFDVTISPRLAAFPTVTPTGQPAVAPVSGAFDAGQAFDAADMQGRSVKGQVFRSALGEAGVQYLNWKAGETGNVNQIAWTQSNTVDELGHAHDHALVDMLDQQLNLVAERVQSLLGAGWKRVVVVTDHGFLLPAAPARKVDLPLAITEGDAARKPRVARLKSDSLRPNFPIVDWTWGPTIEMVSAPGAAAFEAGTLYEHGGLSHQECVIPVIEVSVSAGSSTPAQIDAIRWIGQRCLIDFSPSEAEVVAEVRLAPGDPSSAIGGPKRPSEAGDIKVLVDEEEAAEGTMAYVVLLSADGSVVTQRRTTVGGAA